MFGRIHLWGHLFLGFCLLRVYVTNSIWLLVIGLFRLCLLDSVIECWVCLEICPCLMYNLLICNIKKYFIMNFYISVVMVAISPLLFLTLFSWILFSYWWAWLKIYWLWFFSMKQFLVSLIFPINFGLYFIYFFCDFYHFLPSCLLWDLFCSNSFRLNVTLFKIFLVFWGKPVSLKAFLLKLL